MTASQITPLTYVTGFVYRNDLVFISAQVDELVEQDVSHTKMLQWKMGSWGHYMVNWPVTALCGMEPLDLTLFSMGIDGRIHIATKTGFFEEQIDKSAEGPDQRGMLRDIKKIGKHIYVTGMQRQVYQRINQMQWRRIDQGMVIPIGASIIAGFNSIDGFNEQDIYAVGLDGEIWHFNDQVWDKTDSPTNLSLARVKCVAHDTVYICGKAGILIRGCKNQWEIIDHNVTSENFWGMEWFQEKLYIATSDTLFVLEKDDTLKPMMVNFGDHFTCGHLHANDEIMWSIGMKHLAYTTDGKSWIQVACNDGSY